MRVLCSDVLLFALGRGVATHRGSTECGKDGCVSGQLWGSWPWTPWPHGLGHGTEQARPFP